MSDTPKCRGRQRGAEAHSHIITLKGDSYRLKDKHDELAGTNDNH